MTNEDIALRLGVSTEWISDRTGIHERRIVDGETVYDMAVLAARESLSLSGVDARSVDAVIVCTMTAEVICPALAPLVAKAIGSSAWGFDLNASCTGFLHALTVADSLVRSHRVDTVLVVASEVMSDMVEHDDRKLTPLFGDGAGAVIVKADLDGGHGILSYVSSSDGSRRDLYSARDSSGRQLLHMNGSVVFKNAVQSMIHTSSQAVEQAGMGLDEIDVLIPHQANGRILDAVQQSLGVPNEHVVRTLVTTGNTSSASIPIAIAHATATGMIKPKSHCLLTSFGAGWMGASMVVSGIE